MSMSLFYSLARSFRSFVSILVSQPSVVHAEETTRTMK
jgi:hypothetical protein